MKLDLLVEVGFRVTPSEERTYVAADTPGQEVQSIQGGLSGRLQNALDGQAEALPARALLGELLPTE